MIFTKEGLFIGTVGPGSLFKTFREAVREADRGLDTNDFGTDKFFLLGESEKEERTEVRWSNNREDGVLEFRTIPGEFFGNGDPETVFFYLDPEDPEYKKEEN